MIGAMFKMAFQSFARSTLSPARLMAELNDSLVRILPDADFLTVFYGVLHKTGLELVFTNAGHPRPLVYRRQNKGLEELDVGGPLLGAFPGMYYEEGTIVLNQGTESSYSLTASQKPQKAQTAMHFMERKDSGKFLFKAARLNLRELFSTS